ncbi:DEAD/DEAH box helicase [Olsenella intestinalis]|uniref:DEAD/DEAH box helicase n=1 Tax=Olsenella intestinalis TaxID=2930083 RepID=UPI0020103ABE|nr:DEAD/DEAH box helicase [Olsenella intestinalis]
MSGAAFDPVMASRHIARSYGDYLSTTIRFGDPRLQAQLEEILSQPGFLSKGPFLEATPPYTKGRSTRELVAEGTFCEGMLTLGGGDPRLFDPDLVLYEHQINAIRMAHLGKNYIVTTGTGSGKTECFVLPILDDLLREQEEKGFTPGVKAMILYPMNALANDQLKRLRELLKGTEITFGRYVGDTKEGRKDALNKWRGEHPGEEPLPNELLSREEMRKTPPNILLTNYSMLEYLLLRPKDASFFSSAFGSGWRHIAIDEAHVYSGTLGTEIAYLLRRLKSRVKQATGKDMSLHCYATSATMGTKDDGPQIAKFAEDLFGEPFDHGDNPAVIGSNRDDPMGYFRSVSWGALSPECWEDLRDAISSGDPTREALLNALGDHIPEGERARLDGATPRQWLSTLLLGDENSRKIVSRVSASETDLLDLTDLSRIDDLGIAGLLGDAQGAARLSAMVEVLAFAEVTEGVPILASRYHTFFRAPEGLFISLDDMRLSASKAAERISEDGSIVPVYEVSVCRHCGEAYVLGKETPAAKCAWLDPKRPDVDADDDAVRTYYRILGSADDVDDVETLRWLCPKCGSLHSDDEGGAHRYEHKACERIPLAKGQADEDVSRCGHCGYQNRYAIQPMRVSPEAAGSVVCYDLVRDVPPFDRHEAEGEFDELFGVGSAETVRGGSVVCFSDRRQDAAFFAPAMSRTYNNITRRQIIREAVDTLCREGKGCKASDIADWIAGQLRKTYRNVGNLDTDIKRRNAADAWVYDELMAEDSRNSLEGLGVIGVAPEPLLSLAKEKPAAFEKLAQRSGQSWMTGEDYLVIMRVCLETLREQGALMRPEGAQNHMHIRLRQSSVIKGGSDDAPAGTIRFVPSPRSKGNKRSNFVSAYAREKHGADVSRTEVDALLANFYEDLRKILATLGRSEGTTFVFDDRTTGGFLMSGDFWTVRPGDNLALFLCDTCGCMLQYDTGGICLTRGCHGRPRRVDQNDYGKDRFYKETYREDPLPIRVEEHTAQLSSDKAAKVQQDFVAGDVNVLSCTTTFELGVDVGDLRATFMRNVPPSPANYAQRAGRVGRRAGKPGFAVTFARLRPHDIEYYRAPERIIAGATRAPFCYLSNPAIAIRHIYAVILSEYFRSSEEREACSGRYDDFMGIAEERPAGLDELADFISSNRERLTELLAGILPAEVRDAPGIALSEGEWIEGLIGDGGRLMQAHSLVHDDWDRLERSANEARAVRKLDRASVNTKLQGALLKKTTIGVLAESGVLPKYGFPTDLVSLSLAEQEGAPAEERLDLSRGLRQAIREFAPGSQLVAGGRVWESSGITKPRQRPYELRRFGICPNKDCRAFVVPIDTGESEMECPLCKETIKVRSRILIPSSGFRGHEISRTASTYRRPRNYGTVDVKFVQSWSKGGVLDWHVMPGGRLGVRHASNGHLYAINRGPGAAGYQVCSYCGAAAPRNGKVEHERWCVAKETRNYAGLGTDFTTDVLELTFDLRDRVTREHADWRSLMWAIVQATVSLMNIPEGEVGATTYRNFDTGDESILLYDNVPGGAGRAFQLSTDVESLLNRAYEIVSTCDCGEDSCCYGCLCNYFNQNEQDRLSRGAAKDILESLLQGGVADSTRV